MVLEPSQHAYGPLTGSTELELNELPLETSTSTLPGVKLLSEDTKYADDVQVMAEPVAHRENTHTTWSTAHKILDFLEVTWNHLARGHEQPLIGPAQRDSRRRAWQGGLRWAIVGASAILAFNFFVLVGTAHFAEDGVLTLYRGTCSRVSTLNSVIHVIINVLSTIFLGASNYVMQVLNAPSRKHLNHYHAQGKSLDIGIPSIKNVGLLGHKRAILWALLGISAIPLHLFWNSTVFQTLQTNDYMIFMVSSDFNSTNFSCNGNDNCDLAETAWGLSKSPGSLDYLNTTEALTTYSVSFLSTRRNLILVSNTTDLKWPNGTTAINGSLFRVLDSTRWEQVLANGDENPMWEPKYWWCGSTPPDPAWVTNEWNDIVDKHVIKAADYSDFADMPTCDMSQALSHIDDLAYVTSQNNTDTEPWGIEYGLSEPVPEACTLGFATYIMIIVVVCNIVKVGCMVASIWVMDDDPMVLVGDALSSFLEDPDAVTNGRCLMEARSTLVEYPIEGTIWKSKRRHWFDAPSPFSLTRCVLLCIASLVGSGYLLWLGIQNLTHSAETFSGSTFDGVDPYTMIQSVIPGTFLPSSFRALAFAVLVANTPQLVYSTLYFMYNRLLTSMLAMDEWTRFQYHAATLRVSYPERGQRSTYWLHLPYTYSLPLLGITSIMHWLLSQSLFLARIQRYDAYGRSFYSSYSNAPDMITDVGYSPKAIVASIAVGSAMVLVLVALSLRSYRKGITLVGNSSLAMSAACHPPEDDYDPAHSKLLWGAVDHGDESKPGRCCLTSKPVSEPIEGRIYA